MTFDEDKAAVTFPYEFTPLPKRGDIVQGTDREGKPVTPARVEKVLNPPKFSKTAIVTISVPVEYAQEVRGLDWRALKRNNLLGG
jgi:hypothetical protein